MMSQYKTVAAATTALVALAGCSDSDGQSDLPSMIDTPPSVAAGVDQTVFETRTVTLSGSVDDDGAARVSWSQIAGPTVTLDNAAAVSPTFKTPDIASDTTLIFQLTADDGVNPVVSDEVSINVRNVDEIGIVSPPNPHSFPLVMALAEDADLPFRFYPVERGSEVGPLFASGEADAVFVFSYIGARQRMSGAVPELELIFPFTWRGFFEIADESVSSFVDLIGETVVVSGPVGTSQGGGGDIIFRAAARRQLVDPDVDLNVEYVAGIEAGSELVFSGQAAAIAVPAPASTGMVLFSASQGGALAPAIDFMEVFNGPNAAPDYPSIPENQMPLGGLHAARSAIDTSGKRAALELLIEVYADAAARLMTEPAVYASLASEAFAQAYVETDAPAPPAPTITAAIVNNALVYRSDIPVSDVDGDLKLWIEELLGEPVDAAFFSDAFDVP